MENNEVMNYIKDIIDSIDGDVWIYKMDELEKSIIREDEEEMEKEKRKESEEVGNYGLKGKRRCYKVVG